MFNFEPAYHRLQPDERQFVDGFVAWVEEVAVRGNEPLQAVLARPAPSALDARSVAQLSRHLVATAIGDRCREIDERNRLSEYKTLKTLQNMMSVNLSDFMTVDQFGEPTWHLERATPDQMEGVKSFEYDDQMTMHGRKTKIKITLHDKVKATQLMMQYQNLIGDDGEAWHKRKNKEAAQIAPLPADVTELDASVAYQRLLEG